jgi:ribosome-binding factor A
VKVTPDLQIARVYYTTLGDQKARRESSLALGRATPFLRRKIGQRLRLKRVPQLEFFFDESIERGDRIEQILHEISAERGDAAGSPETSPSSLPNSGETGAKDAGAAPTRQPHDE